MTSPIRSTPTVARRVARALMAALGDRGTDRVFGVPGGGPNLEKVAAAAEAGVPFTLTHGETAAAIAAASYGHLTGTPGLAICTRGPGIASALNGIAQASLDRFPLVVVSDTVTSDVRHRVGHQRFDQIAMTRPATKWSGTLGRKDPRLLAAAAAALALAGPPGAVHLDFDPSVPGDVPPPLPHPSAIPNLAAANTAIAASRRPVVIVGGAAAPWTEAVRGFVTKLGAPALTTYQGAGVIPDGQTVGRFTSGEIERSTLGRADLVIAIGVDAVEPMPAPWDYAVPVVSFMPYPDLVDFFGSRIELVGDIGHMLRQVSVPASAWTPDELAQMRSDVRHSILGVVGEPFSPLEVVSTLIECARPDTVLTVDAGAHFLAIMPIWPAQEPDDLLISNGLATMGFAIPAAIGAALARPNRPVLAVVGDGGAGMTLAELETIARLDLDVTVVIFNDAALSLIEIKQTDGQGGRAAVRFRPTDFAAIAGGFGLPGAVATSASALKQAVAERGPRVVDARINPHAYRDLLRITRG